MRPAIDCPLHATLAAALIALAATAAAAGPAFLKFGGVEGEAARGAEGHKDQIEILSWSWGATQAGGWDGTVKPTGRSADGSQADAAKFGAVAGMHRDSGVALPRDSASGLATGKRQHGWVTVSKPLDRGAVRIKVKFPWLGCAVGARHPTLTLDGGAQRFEFKDAIITSCSTSGPGDSSLPMEEISFNYAKVIVRGWDPEKKE